MLVNVSGRGDKDMDTAAAWFGLDVPAGPSHAASSNAAPVAMPRVEPVSPPVRMPRVEPPSPPVRIPRVEPPSPGGIPRAAGRPGTWR